MKKHKYNNTVIESQTRKHGEKIIQWWKDQGVDTLFFEGTESKEGDDCKRFYGLINGNFSCYRKDYLDGLRNINTIKLPKMDINMKNHKYNDCVIEVLNLDHGKKVIQWWKDQGVDTGSHIGDIVSYYYGLVNGRFQVSPYIDNQINSWNQVDINGKQIKDISLPHVKENTQQIKRGDIVWHWDDDEFGEENGNVGIYLTSIEGVNSPHVVVYKLDEKRYEEGKSFNPKFVKYVRPINENDYVELTVDDISNGLGIHVDPKLIKFKK